MSGAKPRFDTGHLSWRTQYLKPSKRMLVDLAVTKTGLDTTIAFANGFFFALEARDHPVVITPNSESRRGGAARREGGAGQQR